MRLKQFFWDKLEYILAITAVILVAFTLWNANVESNLNELNYNSTEYLITTNLDLSRAIATGNLMAEEINLGLAVNENLIDIMTSNTYLALSSNRKQQTLDANKSFSEYSSKKGNRDQYQKDHKWVSSVYIILSIINGLLAVLSVKKSSAKKN